MKKIDRSVDYARAFYACITFAVISLARAGVATLDADLAGANGVVRTTEPGLSCADSGQGSYRHSFVESGLPAGVMSSLSGDARSVFEIHYDGDLPLSGNQPAAFLLGSGSHVRLSNQRGSADFRLAAGSCDVPAVAFDGATASLPAGTWSASDLTGNGAYRDVTGNGTFSFSVQTNPGADNAWAIDLKGVLEVLDPDLAVKVERVFWGNLGADFALRVVSVVYRIGNTGAGDSFGARLKEAGSPTPGTTVCGGPPVGLASCPAGAPPEQPLGDLLHCADPNLPDTCDVERVTVRYRLGLLQPCVLGILGCEFDARLAVEMPDALDVPSLKTTTVSVRAPNLPPPL